MEIRPDKCNGHPSFRHHSHWYTLVKDGKELVDVNIYLGNEGEFSIHITNGEHGEFQLPNGNYDSMVAQIKMRWSDFEGQQEV